MSTQIVTSLSLKRETVTATAAGRRYVRPTNARGAISIIARSSAEHYNTAVEMALALGLREGSVTFVGVDNKGRNFWKADA
jgi:hypothetical protein